MPYPPAIHWGREKWPSFRWQFKRISLNENFWILTELLSLWSDWQYDTIGSWEIDYKCVFKYSITFSIYMADESSYHYHYHDVIMTTMASQITGHTVVYSTVYSDADQRKHQSSASLAFVLGIHRDRWIPRTKGQLRGKCFHLMTSSWQWCHVSAMASQITGNPCVYSVFILANNEETSKHGVTGTLRGKCIGRCWIPLTKGQ